WGILFSHPRDFTPVCTTELGRAAKLASEFSKRNVKMIALSIDSVQDHLCWSKVQCVGRHKGSLCCCLALKGSTEQSTGLERHILNPKAYGTGDVCCPALTLSPSTQVFIFGPDKKLKLSILYPASTGRNFDEILRVVDSLQLTAYKKVATPVDWKCGDSVVVVPTIPDEEAKKLFPKGVFTKDLPSGKKYLRYTPQP
ncbi:Peroxiredoxin-6, partial [Opisthocomus hoazin]